MQRYILTYYRLRQREPLTVPGFHRGLGFGGGGGPLNYACSTPHGGCSIDTYSLYSTEFMKQIKKKRKKTTRKKKHTHSFKHHAFADYNQVYKESNHPPPPPPPPRSNLTKTAIMQNCTTDVKSWMTHSKLQFHDNKTDRASASEVASPILL